jgi:hypothetical protein
VGDEEVDDRAEALLDGGDRVLDGLRPALAGRVELTADVLQQVQDEIGEVVEVPVEDRAGVAGRAHELVDAELAEGACREELLGREQDLRAGLLALLPAPRALWGHRHGRAIVAAPAAC